MNLKRIFKVLFVSFFVSIGATVGLFILKFHNHPISNNVSDWANFSTYLTGFITMILAVLNLIIVGIIAFEVRKFDEKQSEKNLVMSVRPFASIIYRDSKDELTIRLFNNGIGPLILLKIYWIENASGKTYNSLDEVLEPNKNLQVHQLTSYNDMSIRKDFDTVIFSLERNYGNNNRVPIEFNQVHASITAKLAEFKISIDYTDMYGSQDFNYSTSFNWEEPRDNW